VFDVDVGETRDLSKMAFGRDTLVIGAEVFLDLFAFRGTLDDEKELVFGFWWHSDERK
jgi:hypothetical protein